MPNKDKDFAQEIVYLMENNLASLYKMFPKCSTVETAVNQIESACRVLHGEISIHIR